MNESDWPNEPGDYILLIDVAAPLGLTVGRLGHVTLMPGRYAYVGSARGSGGLRGRLMRHVRRERRQHWHIDHLTEIAPIIYVYYQTAIAPMECRWVAALLALPGATAPVPGFGSSDCHQHCPAHLIRLPDSFQREQFNVYLDIPPKGAITNGSFDVQSRRQNRSGDRR